MKRLDANEIERLLGVMSGKSREAVEFLAKTGARVSEGLRVRAEDVNVERGTVIVPTLKRRKHMERELKIGREFAERLIARVQSGPLFAISRQAIHKAMQKAATAARIPKDRAHPHALRHGLAFRLAEGDIAAPTIRKILGHASLQTTTIYVDEVSAMRCDLSTI